MCTAYSHRLQSGFIHAGHFVFWLLRARGCRSLHELTAPPVGLKVRVHQIIFAFLFPLCKKNTTKTETREKWVCFWSSDRLNRRKLVIWSLVFLTEETKNFKISTLVQLVAEQRFCGFLMLQISDIIHTDHQNLYRSSATLINISGRDSRYRHTNRPYSPGYYAVVRERSGNLARLNVQTQADANCATVQANLEQKSSSDLE